MTIGELCAAVAKWAAAAEDAGEHYLAQSAYAALFDLQETERRWHDASAEWWQKPGW